MHHCQSFGHKRRDRLICSSYGIWEVRNVFLFYQQLFPCDGTVTIANCIFQLQALTPQMIAGPTRLRGGGGDANDFCNCMCCV